MQNVTNTNLATNLFNIIANYQSDDWDISFSNIFLNNQNPYKWINVLPKEGKLPAYGWKLHISATIKNALSILQIALPILLETKIAFKFPATINFLYALNSGHSYDCQAGKFITIYPSNDQQAVDTAWLLHEALKELHGPRILTNWPLTPKSIISYRWGSFISQYQQTLFGEIVPVIHFNDESYYLDKRLPFFNYPPEISNPFNAQQHPREHLQRLIKERYLVAKLITRSLNGDVMLAIDIIKQQRCILKMAVAHSLVDDYGRDVRQRLLAEKNFLDKLNHIVPVPIVYDIFHDKQENLILVMEDIPGVTLEELVITNQCNNVLPQQKEILLLALSLANTLAKIHQCGIIHSDIKLANIIITPANGARLIDFNTAYEIGSNAARYGGGTQGFCSPQLAAGGVPCVSDDIYSLGVILFYYATNGLPARTGQLNAMKLKQIRKINPAISNEFAYIIKQCLAYKQSFTLHQLISMLSSLNKKTNNLTKSINKRNITKHFAMDYLARALNLGNHLVECYHDPSQPGAGFATIIDSKLALHDSRGTAGCIWALSKLVQRTNEPSLAKALLDAATSLSKTKEYGYNKIPGLYVGESGIALALLQAGCVLNNEPLVSAAIKRFEETQHFPHESPDLFNGTAGRLRTALHFWQYSKNPQHFLIAQKALDTLAEQAVVSENSGCWWIIPDLNSLPNNTNFKENNIQLGYAHGAAGIADALLDYYLLKPEPRIAYLIKQTTNWLIKKIAYSPSNNSINWPIGAIDQEITTPFWCHGAAGIGQFLLRATENKILKDGLPLVEQAARSAAAVTWASPIQCHGLAGNIEFLLAVYNTTNKNEYKEQIHNLVSIMDMWVANIKELPWGITGIEAKNYTCGIPGIINCYLRLIDKFTV